jgi:hypothetical protein
MNRRRLYLVVAVSLALVAGMVLLFPSKKSTQPLLQIKIVRRAIEGGKAVMFYRVEVSGHRRIQICNVLTVEEPNDRTSRALLEGKQWISSTYPENFPIGNPSECRREFGVLAPSKAPSWRLRLTVNVENGSLRKRLYYMPAMWRSLRRNGSSITEATWELRNAFGTFDSYVVESDPITNNFTPKASSQASHAALGK